MQRHYTQPIAEIRKEDFQTLVQLGLEEDCPDHDITSESIFSEKEIGKGNLITRESGIFCGGPVLHCLMDFFPEKLKFDLKVQEGEKISEGQVLASFEGSLLTLLRIERIFLNFLQYLSGIATTTNQLTERYPNLVILDTRKTLPGYRKLVKYAVYMGGGSNHRIHLSDMGLIKDNHIAMSGSITEAVLKIKTQFPGRKVELEIDELSQLKEAIHSNPDIILLDNFSLEDTKLAVQRIREENPNILIECSGKITPDKLQALSEIGGIGVSMGYLTHTTRFMDLSLDIEKK